MSENMVAVFIADLLREADEEVRAAQAKFAKNPRAFSRWAAVYIRDLQEQITAKAFARWVRKNVSAVQASLDSEAPAALRQLDSRLLEIRASISRDVQEEQLRKRPKEVDNGRQPPTQAQMMSSYFRSHGKSSFSSTASSVTGRPRRQTQRQVEDDLR